MATRRELHYPDLTAVLAEAESLRDGGYHRVGNWSLGTIAHHLGTAMCYSRDGFPRLWPGYQRAVLRWLFLPRILRRKRTNLRFPAPISIETEIADDEGIARLDTGIQRFQHPDGEFAPHIILGPLSQEQWLQFHLWHCEHHLSFLLPAS